MRLLIMALVCGGLMVSCDRYAKHYSADEITENSQKVNAFLDRRFDESVARNPEFAANLGLEDRLRQLVGKNRFCLFCRVGFFARYVGFIETI
jgi:hypothetical protein